MALFDYTRLFIAGGYRTTHNNKTSIDRRLFEKEFGIDLDALTLFIYVSIFADWYKSINHSIKFLVGDIWLRARVFGYIFNLAVGVICYGVAEKIAAAALPTI